MPHLIQSNISGSLSHATEAQADVCQPRRGFSSPLVCWFFKNGDSLRKQGTTLVLRVGGSKATTGNRWQPGPAGRLARSRLDFHLHYAHRTDWAVFHECALLWRTLHGGPCHCMLGIPFIGPLKIPGRLLVTQLDLIWDQAEAINTHSVLHSPHTFKSFERGRRNPPTTTTTRWIVVSLKDQPMMPWQAMVVLKNIGPNIYIFKKTESEIVWFYACVCLIVFLVRVNTCNPGHCTLVALVSLLGPKVFTRLCQALRCVFPPMSLAETQLLLHQTQEALSWAHLVCSQPLVFHFRVAVLWQAIISPT